MQVVVIKKDNLYKHPFPNNLIMSYWVTDNDEYGNERDLILIEKKDNTWQLVSNDKCHIIEDDKEVENAKISLNKFYLLKIISKETITNALIYVCNENDLSYSSYQVVSDGEFKIGSASTCNIVLNSANINEEHAILTKQNNKFILKTLDTNFGVYVNDHRENNKVLSNGDIIFILGYKIIVLNDYLIINSFTNGISINSPYIVNRELPKYSGELLPGIEDDNAELYSENDYFSRSPRFITSIGEDEMKIDNPPGKQEPDETPVIYTIGPMLTMAMSSIVSASTSVINLMNGRGTLLTVMPAIVISVAMLGSTLLWPTLMRKYNRKKQKKKEEERQQKSIEYLTEKKENNIKQEKKFMGTSNR